MNYNWLIINELGFGGKNEVFRVFLNIFRFVKIHVLIFGSLIYLSYIRFIKQKTYSVGYYIKDKQEIAKQTPENYEILLHSSMGFLI